jgi:glycerol-3-phosphate cytidylyltransferase
MRVLTLGTFGVPHMGHAAFLRRSEAFGQLTVAINSDAFVERYKGSRPPFTEDERLAIVAALGYPVVLNDGPGREVIEALRPDVITIGTDWARRDYLAQIDVTQDRLDALGITIAYVPVRPAGISSTEIARRCRP